MKISVFWIQNEPWIWHSNTWRGIKRLCALSIGSELYFLNRLLLDFFGWTMLTFKSHAGQIDLLGTECRIVVVHIQTRSFLQLTIRGLYCIPYFGLRHDLLHDVSNRWLRVKVEQVIRRLQWVVQIPRDSRSLHLLRSWTFTATSCEGVAKGTLLRHINRSHNLAVRKKRKNCNSLWHYLSFST